MAERGEERERGARGFTLIEMMIVVAIVGLLASLAIPSFIKFHYKAKQAEVRKNLGIIRKLEEAYATEYNTYLEISPYYPGAAGAGRQTWDSTATDFSMLGFEPKGGVYYDYRVGDVNGDQAFVVYGRGDLDGDSGYNVWTMNETGSLTNTNPDEF